MANHSDKSSSEDTGSFPEKNEEQLRILEAGAIQLREKVTDNGIAKMHSAARSLNRDVSTSGHRTASAIAIVVENLLGKLSADTTDVESRPVIALLQGIEALRLLSEELSVPGELKAELDAFALDFEAVVAAMPDIGRGLSGAGMAA